jgi:hypothetical protein
MRGGPLVHMHMQQAVTQEALTQSSRRAEPQMRLVLLLCPRLPLPLLPCCLRLQWPGLLELQHHGRYPPHRATSQLQCHGMHAQGALLPLQRGQGGPRWVCGLIQGFRGGC